MILSIFFLSSGNFLNIVGVFGLPPESIYILPDLIFLRPGANFPVITFCGNTHE